MFETVPYDPPFEPSKMKILKNGEIKDSSAKIAMQSIKNGFLVTIKIGIVPSSFFEDRNGSLFWKWDGRLLVENNAFNLQESL